MTGIVGDGFEVLVREATRSREPDGSETWKRPWPFQRRLADEPLGTVLKVPPGAGKTAAVVLAWVWRRFCHPDQGVRARTPRRLVFALPMRVLTEQVHGEVVGWVERLASSREAVRRWPELAGLTRQDVYLAMGGATSSLARLRCHPDRSSIVVGTIDMLVSRALNHGYGLGRGMFPVDFALFTNDCYWVLDEVQLCGPAVTTLRQLDAFRESLGTVGAAATTYMSATIPAGALSTVDNRSVPDDRVIELSEEDFGSELGDRVGAVRRVGELVPAPAKDAPSVKEVAAGVARAHRRESLTLVVCNTVKMAREIYRELQKNALWADDGIPELLLRHSRFRPCERRKWDFASLAQCVQGSAGRVAVTTQLVEAGVDVSARTLVSEVAPWPSIVQRTGRCNRAGEFDDACMWWFATTPPGKPARGPYTDADLVVSAGMLRGLEGTAVSVVDLAALGEDVESHQAEPMTLRRRDLLSLFDTAPDVSGADVDVSAYIRDSDDLDLSVGWVSVPPEDEGFTVPADEALCPVSLGEFASLRSRMAGRGRDRIWVFDAVESQWRSPAASQRLRPGMVVLVDARLGGYTPDGGWDPASTTPVEVIAAEDDVTERLESAGDAVDRDAGGVSLGVWETLRDHSLNTADHARRLTSTLPELSDREREAVVRAAVLHDIGKACAVWQKALISTEPDENRRVDLVGSGPWAKSDNHRRLKYGDGVERNVRRGFRHDLATAAWLRGPGADVVSDVADPELAVYLAGAHHGHVRMTVHDTVSRGDDVLCGVCEGDVVPDLELGEVTVPGGVLSVTSFRLGGAEADGVSWTEMATRLRDRYGPFRLAMLEMLVRSADYAASAREPEAMR
ncbi:type I-G CRISPR-associated helicase/endonuclease Cas3g [Saccharopolyspora hattusasensis]|uniref:type I-G CRISPR-associated helicase/endonuclease Cas3g n=1 Tax=Saccharopolyspora hattusasensis TaxID=1128679 RepID=UPI003D9628ED